MPHETELTPIRSQYLQVKQRHPDAIVFFRLGDFYETFDEDAQIASRELDVVLTSRNVAKGQRIPMAGVPYHAVESYIARLINKGYKVAICEQTSSLPIKGLMSREVVRVVTPGTLVEPGMLTEKRNNFLCSVVSDGEKIGIAYVDITTGEFATTQMSDPAPETAILRELDRLSPAEVLLSDMNDAYRGQGQEAQREVLRRYPFLEPLNFSFTLYDGWRFELGNCRQALLEHFNVTTLAGYGCENLPLAQRAAGVLVQYLRQNQPAALVQLTSLTTYSTDAFMTLDPATRRNLELTETIRDHTARGSLLGVLDQTFTPMGGRLLRRWLLQPLLNLAQLQDRQAAVRMAFASVHLRGELRAQLRLMGDLERLTNRIVQGIAGPRELLGLKEALARVELLRKLTASLAGASEQKEELPYPFGSDDLPLFTELAELITNALVDEPPATIANGGFIRQGYSSELDAIESSVAEAKAWVAGLERRERERTGIKTLKVGYNKVFGYYLEISSSYTAAAPSEYIRKQTLVNAERYITPELKERETLILNAAERTNELEATLYHELLSKLAAHAEGLLALAQTIAHLDVYTALAEVAAVNAYTCPVLTEDGNILIEAGRHPVVEQMLRSERFVPNDTDLFPAEAIHIITGPNMSGKSTYLRQVALIVLMAQIGSFVPAKSAHIGLVDRIFARVGAQDEITAGQSTFMVEMVEMANILNHATTHSLLILDEIGRGTSTYDGISIAWAVVEYLHNHPRLQAKTLFATHYHELTDLDQFLPRVRNYNVAVADTDGQIVFTRRIVPGSADRSYGIHVAQMAGLPGPIVHRAEEILQELEKASKRVPVQTGKQTIRMQQLSLFSQSNPVLDELRALDVVSMSPLDALNKLFELQRKAQ
ncbi:MAG: DNA mismatch repair protein MutS [Chloroflexi bacterium]|nr:DNA mismatch repair protein MutS [Chloroflexota bacterium]